MATAGMSVEDLQLRKKLLMEELAGTATELLQRNVDAGAIDIHHPERSAGWKPYRHQEYPKMLYHPIQHDPRIEDQRLGVRRRNEANPNLAPLDMPAQEPLKVKVQNKAEEEDAIKHGFVKAPPQVKIEPSAVTNRDPLAASMGVTPAAEPLAVETIIKLNQMAKDDLVKHAKEAYGVEMPEEASKVDIINEIQKSSVGQAA